VDSPEALSYNCEDVTKFIRYQFAAGVSYGILENDAVHQIEGGLFQKLEKTLLPALEDARL